MPKQDKKSYNRQPPGGRGTVRRSSGKGATFLTGLLAVFCLAAVFAVAALLTFAFPVKSIELYGESKYSESEILNAGGVRVGDNVITVSKSDVGANIAAKLPYVESVKVSKSLSGTVSLTVKPAKAAYCINSADSFYIVSDKDKILEKTSSAAEGLPLIKGVFVDEKDIGKTFDASADEKNEAYALLTQNIKKYKLNCDIIDISDSVNITFRVDNRFVVQLGAISNIDGKFSCLKGMIDKISAEDTGIINLKLWTENRREGYFKKCDISDYYNK